MEGSYDALFVGIDWATEAHQVCVVNDRGEIINERSVQHSGSTVAEFIDWLLRLCGG
jgi:hypothetical protein